MNRKLIVALSTAGVAVVLVSVAMVRRSSVPTPKPMTIPETARTTNAVTSDTPVTSYADKDADFVTYTNAKFGFSIDLPKRIWVGYDLGEKMADCQEYTGVSAYPATDGVYIMSDQFVNSEAKRCLPMTTELAAKAYESGTGWKIVSAPASTDTDVDSFVAAQYNNPQFGYNGCRMKAKTPTADQSDVYAVTISDDRQQCYVNYSYEIRFSPKAGKIFSWNRGQAYSFLKDAAAMSAGSGSRTFDAAMTSSFRVLGEEPQTDAVVYENKEAGFSLDLPQSWKDYRVYDSKDYGLEVMLPTNEPGWDGGVAAQDSSLKNYAAIVTIEITPNATFDADVKKYCAYPNPSCVSDLVIGKTLTHTVIMRPAGDIPQEKDFQNKWLATGYTHENPLGYISFFKKSFKAVISTFKLTK